MPDLIDRERALRNLNNLATSNSENIILDGLIRTASQGVERFCNRKFNAQIHDELYSGHGTQRLFLRNFPVLSVERISYCPTMVLKVINTGSGIQQARISVNDLGLKLTRVSSGTIATDEINFSSTPTISDLKDAITALGNSWSASITSPKYAPFPTCDLRGMQGAFNAMNTYAPLRLHTSELASYEVDSEKGWLIRTPSAGNEPGLQMDAPGWFGGTNYWRVIYTAGFETIPEDVQEAAAQWVASMFWQTKRDPGLQQEQVPGVVSRSPVRDMPGEVKNLLRPFRVRNLIRLGG